MLRAEVTEALVRLSAGTSQSREDIFNGKVDANKASWQRKILDRLVSVGYINRTDGFGSSRFAKYAVVKGKTLTDFLENPKALTSLIWPGQGVPPAMAKPELPTEGVSDPDDQLGVFRETPPAAPSQDVAMEESDDIPDAQFKAAVLKVLYGMTQEFAALKATLEKNTAVIEKLAAELGVK